MSAEPRAQALDEDRIPLELCRTADERGDEISAAQNRRRVDQPIVAARLKVVGEPAVVEQVVAEHEIVRTGACGREEVRPLHEDVLVVALLVGTHAAERRRVVAATGRIHQQRALLDVGKSAAAADKRQVALRVAALEEERGRDDAGVVDREQVLGQAAVVQTGQVHRRRRHERAVGLVAVDL